MAHAVMKREREDVIADVNRAMQIPLNGRLRDDEGREFRIVSWDIGPVEPLKLGLVTLTVQLHVFVDAYKEKE